MKAIFIKNIIYAPFENCFDVSIVMRFFFIIRATLIRYEEIEKRDIEEGQRLDAKFSLRLDEWMRMDARENQRLARGTVADSVFFSLSLSLSLFHLLV